MALVTLFVLYFMLLITSADSSCPKSFPCRDIGPLQFPLYENDSECGLFMVDCSSETPRIKLDAQSPWYEIVRNESMNKLLLRNPHFDHNRNCFTVSNLSLPNSPLFSFTVSPNLTLFCFITEPHEHFEGYIYRPCPGPPRYDVCYCNQTSCGVHSGCSVFQMPVYLDHHSGDVLLSANFSLEWNVSHDCIECHERGGQCRTNNMNQFLCKTENSREIVILAAENSRKKVILAAGISGGSVILIVLVVSFAIWYRKKKIEGAYILSRGLSFDPSSKSNEGGSFYYGIPIFSYDELEEITNNFDPSKELGDGGFGTVYYGKLRDGREVAIKRLYEHNYKREQQFMNEIKILTCLKHKNLVTLYGCTSRRSRELLLIYEYISNGTVADHLHGNLAKESPLTWPIRMNIAIETASALSYLHKSDIVHRDVKTNNILLDSNFCVKVADFGLSRLFPMDVTHISTAPQGTPGYVDPEYHQCYQLTDKSDVYSFGVVMVELISSMPAVDISRHRHEINLANLAVNRIQSSALDELVDSNLGYNSDSEVTRMTTSVAELAFQCLQLDKDLRPTMDEVLEFLKEIRNGEEFKFEDREYDGDYIVRGKIPPSPETDDVELLKKVRFQSSPVAVTDIWISGTSTTTSSSIG